MKTNKTSYTSSCTDSQPNLSAAVLGGLSICFLHEASTLGYGSVDFPLLPTVRKRKGYSGETEGVSSSPAVRFGKHATTETRPIR